MIRGGYWGGAWGMSWAGAWGEAWLLLNQPYQELSLKGQVFVRSYLTSIHSVEVAEQIVAVAALNNISVIDAEVVVSSKRRVDYVDAVRKVAISKPTTTSSGSETKRIPKLTVFVTHREPGISANSAQGDIASITHVQSVNIINNQVSIACTYKAD